MEVEVDREGPHYCSQTEPELEDQRPTTPSTPEHDRDHGNHEQTGFHGGADSLDEDSSSDYINNTSEDEDYDEGEDSITLF